MNLLAVIKAVPDHRHPRGIGHPLWLILTVILLDSCAGYWGYKPLVEFTKNHRSTLIKIRGLRERVTCAMSINTREPQHDFFTEHQYNRR